MSDKYLEKTFLYLVLLSVLLHLAVFGLISQIPPAQMHKAPEATMVDLTDLPELPRASAKSGPPKSTAEKPGHRTRETTPKRTGETDHFARQPAPLVPSPNAPPGRLAMPVPVPSGRTAHEMEPTPVTRGEGLFKPKSGVSPSADLFPSTGKLARIEESYRKKYEAEVEERDSNFLNTQDIQFGSFLRRFETAVYGVWRYPDAAILRGIEGVTPVKISFNRSGEITGIKVLESSGSKILDDEVLRTLRALGPIGPFPKNYSGSEYNLIVFFGYGIIGGSRLH